MINKYNVCKFCKDDISLIENYEEAINSEDRYDCHHRLELTAEGEIYHTKSELIELDLYYNRPSSELIFLPFREHSSLHLKARHKHPSWSKVKDKVSKSLTGKKVKHGTCWNKGIKGEEYLKHFKKYKEIKQW